MQPVSARALKFVFWPLDRALALITLGAVRLYQRFISPHKGFACAHGALTGDMSCSEAAADALSRMTFSEAVPKVREQFNKCRRTYSKFRRDMFDQANSQLEQIGALATVGAIGCCPGGDGGGGDEGPLGSAQQQVAQVKTISEQTAG